MDSSVQVTWYSRGGIGAKGGNGMSVVQPGGAGGVANSGNINGEAGFDTITVTRGNSGNGGARGAGGVGNSGSVNGGGLLNSITINGGANGIVGANGVAGVNNGGVCSC